MDTQELQRLKNKYDIIGNDAALNRALEMAVAVAPTDLTVLVTGESGVGKENIPKIIHQNSIRRNGKYFAVNCGAIPEGTIDSELFGHEKGSFTGATESRKGYFEEADGGTLFLDEIGELPLASQAKLLRVLQSGEYIRVGSSKVGKTDVRVIAATNVDLRHAVARGKFREDLYYRLDAIQITMPSLRERKDDIYLLFRKFASDFSEKYGMRKISLTREAIQMLMAYRWPGNIRQLKNVAETVAALESEKLSVTQERFEIDAQTLSQYIPKDGPNNLPVRFRDGQGSISEDDKTEIFKALYGLSNEVSNLRGEVNKLKAMLSSGHALGTAERMIPASEPVLTHPAPVWTRPDEEDVDIQDNLTMPPMHPHAAPAVAAEPEIDEQEQHPDKGVLSIKDNKSDLIQKALEKHHGNRKMAAKELGISERTLYRYLQDNRTGKE